MELRLLLTLLRRWAWLLILGAALGAGGAYLASQYQEPEYQATTKVMVLQPQESKVTADLVPTDQELIQTYITLLTTKPVLTAAEEKLGFSISKSNVSARQNSGTRLLEVTVMANDPERAAQVANTLVEVLIIYNETLQANRFISSEESLQTQIAQIEQQIQDLQSNATQDTEQTAENLATRKAELETQIFNLQGEIVALELEIDALAPQSAGAGQPVPTLTPGERSQLLEKKTRLAQLRFTLNLAQNEYSSLLAPANKQENQAATAQQTTDIALYRQIYTSLLTNYEAVRLARLQSTPSVVQVEPAEAPLKPVKPQPVQNTLLGAAVGLIIMGAIAFLIEYLDDTLKTPADIAYALKLPVIGFVSDAVTNGKNGKENGTGGKNGKGNGAGNGSENGKGVEPYVALHPRSPVAEAFRIMRTNLEFASVDKPLKTILITSAGPAEGKTTTTANLGVVMAQGHKQTILLDCDLRRPRIHHLTGLSNHIGLSDLFRGQASVADVVRPTKIEGLSVITSGGLPPNPAEVLSSAKMTEILQELGEAADIVLIDSPPSIVSDSAILAGKVDAVILIVQPGKTHADAASAMLEQLQRAGANVIGVALNRIPRKGTSYYGGYRYYYSPYYENNRSRYYLENTSTNGHVNGHHNGNLTRLKQVFRRQDNGTGE